MAAGDFMHRLAELLASYEMDEPHLSQPDLDVGEEVDQYYPDVPWEVIAQRASEDHYGDCTNQANVCLRCWADQLIHKANWIAARFVEE